MSAGHFIDAQPNAMWCKATMHEGAMHRFRTFGLLPGRVGMEELLQRKAKARIVESLLLHTSSNNYVHGHTFPGIAEL